MNSPVTVMNPFRGAVALYRKAGWGGTIPLPYKEKHPPPTGFTGHRADYPDVEQLKKWMNDGRSNIGLRLAGVDNEFEVIGIDVDHYKKGGKSKVGGNQLKSLEATLGDLPPTWISSSRTDGISGIRYYRVPRGLAFRGQVDKDIECISKGYRFAVVWPSIHPEGGTYWWFPPGIVPDSERRQIWNGDLPLATALSLLPDKWLTYLTQDKMRAESDDRIDMDSEVEEIYQWADDTFHGNEDDKPCSLIREKLDKHKKLISEEATSHDKIVNAHMNLFHLASEGHIGWLQAVNELEEHFKQVTVDRGKRDLGEVRGEAFRSRTNGLRKVKAQCDDRLKIGATAVDKRCDETGMCATDTQASGTDDGDPPDPLDDIPGGALKGTGDYEMNDDGNAEHLVDMFSTIENGVSFRWAEGHGWIVWHNGVNPHWERDELGDQIVRRMWHRVKNRQLRYVEALKADLDNQINGAVLNQNGNPVMTPQLAMAKAKYQDWKKFAVLSGNNRNAENALKAAKSRLGVSIDVNMLDQNPLLLGVENGVVDMTRDNVHLRKPEAKDFVTLNTNMPWIEDSAGHNHAIEVWQDYLDTFIPDAEDQKNLQIVLGHCLIGGNPEKIIVALWGPPNTGKSTLITALQIALGEYCETVNQSIFQNHKLNPILADAISRRVIVCSEFDEADQLSASMVKRLTGGHDEIRTEKKGSNVKFSGIPQFVPILATNEVPHIAGVDKALENRLYPIPFNITPKYIKKESANQVKAICGPVILHWLIDGYKQYRNLDSLPITDRIQKAKKAFVAQLDEIATFASDCVKPQTNPAGFVARKDMYAAFQNWWRDNNYQENRIPNNNLFTRRMTALGFESPEKVERLPGGRDRVWTGVRLEKRRVVVKMSDIRPKTEQQSVTD